MLTAWNAAAWIDQFEATGGKVVFSDGTLYLGLANMLGDDLERMMAQLGAGRRRDQRIGAIRCAAFHRAHA